MVLGVDWLSTLGPILWNFTELTMKFTQQNREVVLRSLVPAANNLEMARKFQRMQEGRRPKCK
jgi:hypothetical protein